MSNEQAVFNAQWNAATLAQQAEEARVDAAREAESTERMRQSPFVLMRPSMFPDGNQWCALYGDDLQSGVCGFGDTPELAQADFDNNWRTQRAKP